jgi:hypothetical protein
LAKHWLDKPACVGSSPTAPTIFYDFSMKKNAPTYIFLLLLLIIFGYREYTLGKIFNWSPITTLSAFVLSLWSTINFFEFIVNLKDDSLWFKVFPFLNSLRIGAYVGFWERQLIFAVGFFFGYCLLLIG